MRRPAIQGDGPEAPTAGCVTALPDPDLVRATATTVLRLVLEAIDERRPVGHLDAVLTPPVLGYVRAARLGKRPQQTSRLRSGVPGDGRGHRFTLRP